MIKKFSKWFMATPYAEELVGIVVPLLVIIVTVILAEKLQ